MKRRSFLFNSSAITAGLALTGINGLPVFGKSKSFDIGMQLYSMSTALSDDFTGTVEMLAEAGYKNLEFAGPYYFSPEEEIKNNILIQQMGLKGYGYYNYTPAELRKFLDDFGLTSISAHVSTQSLEHDIDEILKAATTIGHKYLICPMTLGPDIDTYKNAADKFNRIGESCKKAGIKFGYHNHSQEFHDFDGERPIDVLMERTDPDLVIFELDLFWTTVAGVDPAKFIKKHSDRIRLVHIKDMARKMDAPSTDWRVFTDMSIGREILTNQTIVGDGIIDFKDILRTAEKEGIEHYIIESDFPPDPIDFARKSFQNLNQLI
jgi:sugar phosphate isomerase/epimerase